MVLQRFASIFLFYCRTSKLAQTGGNDPCVRHKASHHFKEARLRREQSQPHPQLVERSRGAQIRPQPAAVAREDLRVCPNLCSCSVNCSFQETRNTAGTTHVPPKASSTAACIPLPGTRKVVANNARPHPQQLVRNRGALWPRQ